MLVSFLFFHKNDLLRGNNKVLGTQHPKAGILNSIAITFSVTKDIINIKKAHRKSTFTIYDVLKKTYNNTIESN